MSYHSNKIARLEAEHERDRLRAENRRLREALERIAQHTQMSVVTYGSGIAVEPSKSALVARKALAGDAE